MTSRMFAGVLRAVERGAFPRTRKWAWRRVYDILSRVWRDEDWRFMNYGFVPEESSFPLRPEDEAERAFIGLYHQAVDGLPCAGARILEVGAGRGGGTRYMSRYLAAAAVVGLDYSPETVRLARKLNRDAPALTFEIGDAERLPFPDGSFDIVVNIESSHCYADVSAFVREAVRVLAPGGWLSFADMRSSGMLPELDRQFAAPKLELVSERDLSAGVVRALDALDERKRARIGQGWLLRRFMVEFAGAKGSILYEALSTGAVVYTARRYRKVAREPG